MRSKRLRTFWLVVPLLGSVLAACAPATPEVTETLPPTQPPTAPPMTPTPLVEERLIEIEWPGSLRLGDSDIVRLSLVPTAGGYAAEVEYPEHELQSQPVDVPYRPGYEALAVARLDAAGMTVEPSGDQTRRLAQGVAAVWRWTVFPGSAGRHRMNLLLTLFWVPLEPGGKGGETVLWQGGLEVRVEAPLGLSAPQARALGLAGALLGGVLTLPLAEFVARRRLERARARRLRSLRPNQDLLLEPMPGLSLQKEERALLQAVFKAYDRLVIETRFASGYSGARTLLARPIRADGRSDAHTIVKIGSRRQIVAEYANYETFVRHTLPPITSRLQGPPVVTPGVAQAALRYTFVGAPGAPTTSFRTFAITRPSPESARLIEERLFGTFGRAWWMQRRPYSFRLAQEYDRLLPVNLLIDLVDASPNAVPLEGETEVTGGVHPGDLVCLRAATVVEARPERGTMTLAWPDRARVGGVRVRLQGVGERGFMEGHVVRQLYGRVTATRAGLLAAEAAKALPGVALEHRTISMAGRAFPNPLFHYEALLQRQVAGSCSVIHGDLNLENVLVGPGDLVWLIDFAATREGHTLFDFARLEVELATQVVAKRFADAGLGVGAFVEVLDGLSAGRPSGDGPQGDAACWLGAVRGLSGRCLFDPADWTEFRLALSLAYLGALKFANLDEIPSAPLPKRLAFAAAAYFLPVG